MTDRIPYTKVNVFNATDLWADPEYSISKLFDGFSCSNFPLSCFLEWTIPTEEEINDADMWIQDEIRYLKQAALTSTQDENGNNTLKEGEFIFVFLKGKVA